MNIQLQSIAIEMPPVAAHPNRAPKSPIALGRADGERSKNDAGTGFVANTKAADESAAFETVPEYWTQPEKLGKA
jgi:hypothetical protein